MHIKSDKKLKLVQQKATFYVKLLRSACFAMFQFVCTERSFYQSYSRDVKR